MDQKLIDALSNFGEAIETLVDTLKDQKKEKKPTRGISEALFGKGNLNETLVNIQDDIKEIKNDNKSILKNQEEILELNKKEQQQRDAGIFEKGSEQVDKIKEGVGTIVLIAGAVLAIGMAFKIISPVDLPSVLSLSLAITTIGLTLAQLSESGIPSPEESLDLGISVLSFTTGIMLSSLLIQYIPKITPDQFLTFLGIGATFGLLFFLGFGDAIEQMSKVDLGDILMLPITLVAISASIRYSSEFLAETQPIDSSLLLNIALMGLALAAVTIAFSIPLFVLSKLGAKAIQGAVISVVALPLISLSVMLSSYLLNQTEEVEAGKLYNIMFMGVTLAIVSLALLIPITAIGLLVSSGIGGLALAAGALGMVVVVGALATSSHLLASGDYSNGPSPDWAMGFSLTLLALVPAMIALGSILSIPIVGAMILAGGFTAMNLVAQSITEVSHILNKGDYSNGPPVEWATGIAITLGAFSPVYGMLVANSIIGGDIGPEDFKKAIRTVSFGILEADTILSSGDYTGGPPKEWSEGVGEAIGAFSPVYKMLLINGLFGAAVGPEEFSKAIKTVSKGILQSAETLAEGKASYGNYPSEEWSEGVGKAISAFAPVYESMNSSLGGILDSVFGGDTGKKFENAMVSVANGIVKVSDALAGKDLKQTEIDPDYADGLSKLVSGFALAYKYIIEEDIEAEDILEAQPAMFAIASSIGPLNSMLSEVNEIGEFNLDLVELSEGIDVMADSVEKLANSLDELSSSGVDNFRNLTASFIGLSIIDSEQLSKVIDTFAEKEEKIDKIVSTTQSSFGEGIKDTAFGLISSASEAASSIISSVTGQDETENVEPDTKLIDLSNVEQKLDSVIGTLQNINRSNESISSKLNQLKEQKEPTLD